MKISIRTAFCLFALILLLGIAILGGISYLGLKYTDKYPDDEKAYLWYTVGLEPEGYSRNISNWSASPKSRVVSYAYIEEGCKVREYGSDEKNEYALNYSYCLSKEPPGIVLDPERFIGAALERVNKEDPSAQLKKFEYMLPEITKFYFGKEEPYVLVCLRGNEREYVVFYETGTGKEEEFLEEPLLEYPICKTTAESNDGRCTNMRFQLGEMVHNQALLQTWQQALDWIKEETEPSAVIQTWWDYYALCSVKTGRKCIPDPRDADQIDAAAAFYMSDIIEDEALEALHKNGAKYIIVDWDLVGKSPALRYISSSKAGIANYSGYISCTFSPGQSAIKPVSRIRPDTTYSMFSTLVYSCSNGRYLIFEIENGRYSPKEVYLSQDINHPRIPWREWQKKSGASILGVQTWKDILGNCLNYTEGYLNLPTYTSFVYLPGENETANGENTAEYLLSRLYFGEHLEEYKQAELADSGIEPLQKIRLVPGFESAKRNNSYYGYVKVFEVTG